VLSAIALASVAAGAINVAAAATVGRGSTQNLAFFSIVAAAQLVWGVVSMAEAPRWWLAVGAAGNLVVVATWVVSRTVGLPLGDYAGITLPVGFPDALATALEAVIVVDQVPRRRRRGCGGRGRADPGRRAGTGRRVRLLAGRVRPERDFRRERPVRSRHVGWGNLGRRLLGRRLLSSRHLLPSFRRKDGSRQSRGAAGPVVP
jgi:hypothetical protein